MDQLTTDDAVLIHSILHPPSVPSLNPGRPARAAGPKAAVRRCNSAWKRAFNSRMEENDNEYLAADEASEAYRGAMPLLDGYNGVREFIACVAHGLLIGAIPRDRGGQLLYAAQVAMAALQCEPQPPQTDAE